MPAAIKTGDNGVVRVVITGAATVASVREMHEVMLDALASAGDVVLDIRGVERADFSFIQLLLSTIASLNEAGRAFCLDGDAGPLLEAAGDSPTLSALLGTTP